MIVTNLIKKVIHKKYEISIIIFFCAIAFLIYYPSINNRNYFWDDDYFIFSNFLFNKAPSWTSFWIPNNSFFKSWALGYTQFWFLNKFLSIENIVHYKLINITMHLINSFLVFFLAKKVKIKYPLICSCIFLIHPLQVETVSWTFQLLTILSFTYFITSLIFFINYIQKNNVFYMLLSFSFFLFSLSTKSIAIFAPFIYFFIFLINHQNFKKYLLLMPFFIASLFFGLLSQKGAMDISLGKINKIENVITYSEPVAQVDLLPNGESKSMAQIMSNFDFLKDAPNINANSLHNKNIALSKIESEDLEFANFHHPIQKTSATRDVKFEKTEVFKQFIHHYILKLFIPYDLSFIYPKKSYSMSLLIFTILFILLFFYFIYKYIKDKKNYLYGITIILFTLLPFSGITFITFFYWSNVSDRYSYFPLLGISILVALFYEFKIKGRSLFIAAYIFYLSMYTTHYGFKFNNPMAIYQEVATFKYHPVIYSLLIEQYIYKLDYINAKKTLDLALSKFPTDPLILNDTVRVNSLGQFYKLNNLKQVTD